MYRYVLKRVLHAVIVVWASFTVTFVLLYLLPSDPVEIMLRQNGAASEGTVAYDEAVAQLRARYGLDQPIYVQYWLNLVRFLTLDLGDSLQTGTPIAQLILPNLAGTAALASAALVIALTLGFGIAFLATFTRNRWLSQALHALPSLGMAVPTFWIGLMLIDFFSFRLGMLPALGDTGFESLILPAITLSIPTAALIAQVLTKSLDAALDERYIDTARAKGASRLRVHLRHALRNAMLPVVTLIGILVGGLLAGSIIVETVFTRQGIGRLTHSAVMTQDIPLVQTIVVVTAIVFASINLLIDLVYPLLDPRIRHVDTAR